MKVENSKKEVEFPPGKKCLCAFLIGFRKKSIERIQTSSKMALDHYRMPLLVTDRGGKVPHEIIHNMTTADAPQTIYYIRERFCITEETGIPCTI